MELPTSWFQAAMPRSFCARGGRGGGRLGSRSARGGSRLCQLDGRLLAGARESPDEKQECSRDSEGYGTHCISLKRAAVCTDGANERVAVARIERSEMRGGF